LAQNAFRSIGELLTKALIGGDFDLYRSILTLPVRFTPREGKAYVLQDEAALRADFDLYVSIIRLHGVTDIYRQVVSYEPVEDGKVWVNVMTNILVRALRLADPFPTRMLLRRTEDGWRIAEIETSEGHLNWTMGRAGLSATGGFEAKDFVVKDGGE
jgi:hypothetical protein